MKCSTSKLATKGCIGSAAGQALRLRPLLWSKIKKRKKSENVGECPCLENASISVPDIKGTGVHWTCSRSRAPQILWSKICCTQNHICSNIKLQFIHFISNLWNKKLRFKGACQSKSQILFWHISLSIKDSKNRDLGF